MPFYLWLHWIAREKVLALHRRHLDAEKRAGFTRGAAVAGGQFGGLS